MPLTDNSFTDLATAPEPPLGWTESGTGVRAGITITTTGNNRTYTRADLDMTNRQAFLIEATVSASALGAAGELGARLWARFTDPDTPPFPPGAKHRFLDVRLLENGSGQRRFGLFDGLNNTELASVDADWTSGGPRFRVRLKRQGIAGVPTIFLQVEPSSSFDDPVNPNPSPDTATSKSVALSAFAFSVGNINELGFGNFVNGTYSSDWESIHVARCDDATTILPYWPVLPPQPTASHVDQGPDVVQTARLTADLGSPPLAEAYLTNDSATFALTHAGGTATSVIPDPSTTSSGVHNVDFPNLADDQTVSGTVAVADVSGRTRISTAGTVLIPDRTTPLVFLEVFPGGGSDFVSLTPGSVFSAATKPVQIAVRVIDDHLNEVGSSLTINGTVLSLGALTKDPVSATEARYIWEATTSTPLASVLLEGNNNVQASIADLAGQASNPSTAFTLDTVAPNGTILISRVTTLPVLADFQAPSATPYDGPVLVGVRVSDADMADLAFGDGTPPPSPPFSTLTLDGGAALPIDMAAGFAWIPGGGGTPHILYWAAAVSSEAAHSAAASVRDLVGNIRDLGTVNFAIDLTAPTGTLQVNDGGGWATPVGSYTATSLDVGVETSDLGLDLNASYLQIQLGANPPQQQLLSAATFAGGRYVWSPSPAINAAGSYNVTVVLVDLAGNPGAPLTASFVTGLRPSFFVEGGQGNNPNATTVSHTHDDNTDLDPTGLLLLGASNDNFIGVHISNAVGAATGDCKYRHFTIPACLFTGTSEWRLITTANPAPVIANIAPGTNKPSINNVNFNKLHPNFPLATDPVWASVVGDILHTCTAVVLHSPEDPLLFPDGLGGFVPIDDIWFDDPAQFIAQIMSRIANYNGATGSYWQAVFGNLKIVNRNINIQNLGT